VREATAIDYALLKAFWCASPIKVLIYSRQTPLSRKLLPCLICSRYASWVSVCDGCFKKFRHKKTGLWPVLLAAKQRD